MDNKNFYYNNFLFILAATALISSCGSDNGPGATPAPQSTTPTAGLSPSPSPTSGATTFTQINQSILQPSCVSCHSGAAASAGVDLSSYSTVITQVQPGNPAGSRLYQVVSSGQMPPSGPLPAAQVQQLQSWIAAGAPNN